MQAEPWRSTAWGGTVPNSTRPRGGRTLKFRVESLELRELHTLNIQHSTLNTYRPPRGRFLCQPPARSQSRGLLGNSPHGAGFIGDSALHPINRMPIFLADNNISECILLIYPEPTYLLCRCAGTAEFCFCRVDAFSYKSEPSALLYSLS